MLHEESAGRVSPNIDGDAVYLHGRTRERRSSERMDNPPLNRGG